MTSVSFARSHAARMACSSSLRVTVVCDSSRHRRQRRGRVASGAAEYLARPGPKGSSAGERAWPCPEFVSIHPVLFVLFPTLCSIDPECVRARARRAKDHAPGELLSFYPGPASVHRGLHACGCCVSPSRHDSVSEAPLGGYRIPGWRVGTHHPNRWTSLQDLQASDYELRS